MSRHLRKRDRGILNCHCLRHKTMTLVTQEGSIKCIGSCEFDSIGEYELLSLRRMVSRLFG